MDAKLEMGNNAIVGEVKDEFFHSVENHVEYYFLISKAQHKLARHRCDFCISSDIEFTICRLVIYRSPHYAGLRRAPTISKHRKTSVKIKHAKLSAKIRQTTKSQH